MLCVGNLQMLLEFELFKKKKRKEKKIKIALSLGYPIPISKTKDVICCSNGYIYHFLDYIKWLLFVNANVIHHV